MAWLLPVAAAVVDELRHGCIVGGDTHLFVGAGRTLLSSHWRDAFSSSTVQAGPLQLALFGSVGRSQVALALVLATATVLLLLVAARAAGVTNPVLLGGVGLLGVLSGLTRAGGHPADAVLPLIWILAAVDARRGHARRAGLLVGLSAGLETWGILGVAVLAFAPRRRDALVGTVAAGGAALALFLPFVLGGHFSMLSFEWRVTPPSPLSLFLPAGTPFGWPLRLAQGAVAVSAGAAVARLLRRSEHALWVVPLAIVAARLLLDPLLISYYLAAPKGPVFVGAAAGFGLLAARRLGAPAAAL
ncbi:MAG TPA: hypothetical protein VE985_02395 [Gaiellaceae bacterium]|nr:hypothetical protein [Gaiellaceae bacterium]